MKKLAEASARTAGPEEEAEEWPPAAPHAETDVHSNASTATAPAARAARFLLHTLILFSLMPHLSDAV